MTTTRELCRQLETELRPALGITSDWRIWWHLRWDEDEQDSGGTYTIHIAYRQVHINLWPARMRDRLELVEAIVHELCHVSHWPFTAYATLVSEASEAGPLDSVLSTAWTRAQEEYVSAVMMQRKDIREVIERHAGACLQYPL